MKIELILEGLDCANCAIKIEQRVKGLNGVAAVSMNFVTKTLNINLKEKADRKVIFEESKQIIKSLEPHVKVIDKSSEKKICTNEHKHTIEKKEIIRLIIGTIIFATGIIFNFNKNTEFLVFLTSFLLIGSDVLISSLKRIRGGQVFDENFLMSIATIGAFIIGEYPEGVAVMLFYQIGELFQTAAVNKSRKSIKALMDIRPDYANLKIGDEYKTVSPEDISIGDIIVVKPGERIPLDGKVISGKSMLDTSALTGESLPREVKAGDEVLSGVININGLLSVEVLKEYSESTVTKILELVENASMNKAPTENFITKFAKYYTPFVVVIAAGITIIPTLFFKDAVFSDWLYRALIFLVVSCPCALVISIPLGFFGGIGAASRNGILIKGGNFLEALVNVDTVVFDKTGTITKGVFNVTKLLPASGVEESKLLELAAYAESHSGHPIAESIKKAYDKDIIQDNIEGYEELAGYGIKVQITGKTVLAGSAKLMKKEEIEHPVINEDGTLLYIAADGMYTGCIVISDELKPDSIKAVKELRQLGIHKTVMLTGDIKQVGENVAAKLGIDEVYTELLPKDKVELVEKLEKEKNTKGKLIFAGDGINDAPVLARADIGIAMGGLGSDAAIEAADIVIMNDEPSKISTAIKIARYTRKIVWQNIILAFGVKFIVLILAAGGLSTMWEAVFADVGVALLAVFNAIRVLNVKNI
ncbi:MAG: heavy metal translocating P-type ATPase [Bacillota bacterium]